ncbi:hypothetical protein VTJ04DRAFT_10032 [Mycothermus thermophilus]|uniref:uncharacterized protein n=1 Tax=Humicola insolens TaxID=85995 RepID=UPI0037432EC3
MKALRSQPPLPASALVRVVPAHPHLALQGSWPPGTALEIARLHRFHENLPTLTDLDPASSLLQGRCQRWPEMCSLRVQHSASHLRMRRQLESYLPLIQRLGLLS